MGVKDRRQFNQKFKRNAVSMVLEKGIPVKKVALDMFQSGRIQFVAHETDAP